MFAALRRHLAARKPLPPSWEPLISQRFPLAARLPPDERARFLLHLKVFALSKVWEGAHGLSVTDEMKVAVSGAAARLARNLPLSVYDDLRSVVIYEGHFKLPGRDDTVLGEARQWGAVILSWDAVRHGLSIPTDGHDTALHEFAHVLDMVGGHVDGTPELHEAADYQAWTAVFSKHYFALRERPERSVLRAYGATNEAEFFAVATEAFFEKPLQLSQKAPDLYAELARYYRVDPRTTLEGRR